MRTIRTRAGAMALAIAFAGGVAVVGSASQEAMQTKPAQYIAPSRNRTSPNDMQRIAVTLGSRFQSPATLPVSFRLGERRINGIPNDFCPKSSRTMIDANLTRLEFNGVDPATGLLVEVDALAYCDYPVYEWTVWLENTGKADTPLVSEILGGDFSVRGAAPLLHHGTGDECKQTNFETLITPLTKRRSC